uniref:Uncharacterized protein n=1 Tax=Cacopsylla melanoneura TaxID=428564 RepID=A0A8D9DUE0_9HEMI
MINSFVSDENNKSEIIEPGALSEKNTFSEEEKKLMERARIKFGINNKNNNETNVFVTSVQNISNKTPETIGGLTVDFSKEELELLKRASQKMKDWDTNSEQKLRTTKDFERTGFHDSQLEGDTRERLRKMLAESSEKKLDYSLEIRKLESPNFEHTSPSTKKMKRSRVHSSHFVGDTRERLRKMLGESSQDRLDYSLEIRKLSQWCGESDNNLYTTHGRRHFCSVVFCLCETNYTR